MMTPDEIKKAIHSRLDAMEGSCNSAYIDHNDGVLRGLIWALTGEDPGTYLSSDVKHIFELARIPFLVRDGRVEWYDNEDQLAEAKAGKSLASIINEKRAMQ